jgi:hypothetical protein
VLSEDPIFVNSLSSDRLSDSSSATIGVIASHMCWGRTAEPGSHSDFHVRLYFAASANRKNLDFENGGNMSALEFALSALIVIVAFLAFALTVVVVLLGEKDAKAKTKKVFQSFIKTLISLLPW